LEPANGRVKAVALGYDAPTRPRRNGLECGDTVFAATKPSNVEALSEELADERQLVEFHDTSEWKTRPYDRLQAFKRLVDELQPGGVLGAMGEPGAELPDRILD
jgi:hypothetical protein